MADANLPPFLDLKSALRAFVTATSTQSQGHIKPLHRHLAIRLVIEGGFSPDEVAPRPPLAVKAVGRRKLLVFVPNRNGNSEQTVLGGLKSKAIDVVVAKPGVGPVIAISVKGTTGAFRNLTNRMEEAIGDSANIHIMYPGLVYSFLHILRGNDVRRAEFKPSDVALKSDGTIAPSIRRYHDVLLGLAGRLFVRDDVSRYESVGLGLVNAHNNPGELTESFPEADSPLHLKNFFDGLLRIYDRRFPYVASSMPLLRRAVWDPDSPALVAIRSGAGVGAVLGYEPRLEGEDEDEDFE